MDELVSKIIPHFKLKFDSVKSQLTESQQFELIGAEYFKKEGYFLVMPILYKKHGFDGIFFTDDDQVMFFESKLHSTTYGHNLESNAIKTIVKGVMGRYAETQSAIDKIMPIVKDGQTVFYTENSPKVIKNMTNVVNSLKTLDIVIDEILKGKKELSITHDKMLQSLCGKGDKTTSCYVFKSREVIYVRFN